jgi:hypothetical protein
LQNKNTNNKAINTKNITLLTHCNNLVILLDKYAQSHEEILEIKGKNSKLNMITGITKIPAIIPNGNHITTLIILILLGIFKMGKRCTIMIDGNKIIPAKGVSNNPITNSTKAIIINSK